MTKILEQFVSKIKILNLVYLKCLELIKYNLEKPVVDYIKLSVNISLVNELGNKLVTHLSNISKNDGSKMLDAEKEKIIDIIEQYVGQTMMVKTLLAEYDITKKLDISTKIKNITEILMKLPKDIKNKEVIIIFKTGGEVEDSDILELGGFLDTPKLAYPTNLFSVMGKLDNDRKKIKEISEKWKKNISSYFRPIVSSIEDYIERRANYNKFYDIKKSEVGEKNLNIDDIIESIDKIKKQDRGILEMKLRDHKFPDLEEVKKNLETIKILRLNPKRRSEVIGEISENITEFERIYHSISEVEDIDEKNIKLIECLNKIGYGIDYLLSKENKITCINNIELVVSTYLDLKELNLEDEAKLVEDLLRLKGKTDIVSDILY